MHDRQHTKRKQIFFLYFALRGGDRQRRWNVSNRVKRDKQAYGGRGFTYPSFAVTLLAEETPSTTTSVTCFDGGRVRYLKHFHFAAEEIRRIGWDVPRARGGTTTGTIDVTTTVRHKRPRRLSFLRKCLDFVLWWQIVHFQKFTAIDYFLEKMEAEFTWKAEEDRIFPMDMWRAADRPQQQCSVTIPRRAFRASTSLTGGISAIWIRDGLVASVPLHPPPSPWTRDCCCCSDSFFSPSPWDFCCSNCSWWSSSHSERLGGGGMHTASAVQDNKHTVKLV